MACGREEGLFWLNFDLNSENRKKRTEHRARGLPRVSSLVHMRQMNLFVAGTADGWVNERAVFNSPIFFTVFSGNERPSRAPRSVQGIYASEYVVNDVETWRGRARGASFRLWQ